MQTLNGTLAAAQNGTERKPLVELMSDKFVPDIPFTGQRLTSDFPHYGQDGDTTDELSVNAIALSDGRLAIISVMGDREWGYGNPYVRLTLTNLDRTEFTNYTVYMMGSADAPFVEMPDGNLGVMNGSGLWSILNVTDSPGTVMDHTDQGWGDVFYLPRYTGYQANSQHTTVVRLANGTYMVAYVSDDGVYPAHGNISIKISTSADFTSWSAPVAISMPYLEPLNPKYNPFLFQTEDGVINLLFEYVELWTAPIGSTEKVNIYHFVSDDNGATWSEAPGAGVFGAITNYADFTVTPRHPYAIPLGAGNWRISYHEARSAMHMNTSAFGWEGTDAVVWQHFDNVSRREYVVNKDANNYGNLSSIVVVNPDTWTVTKCIEPSSGPTFGDMWWAGGGFADDAIGERELVVVRKGNHIGVYDGESDTIKEFHFEAWPAYGVEINTTPRPQGQGSYIGHPTFDMNIVQMYLDYATRTLYLYWQYGYAWGGVLAVGKIELDQTGPEYNHDILFKKDAIPPGSEPGQMPTEAQMAAINGDGDFAVYPDDNLVVITGGQATGMEGLGGPWNGVTLCYAMNGDLVRFFDSSMSDLYPYRGIRRFVKIGYDLWGVFRYEPAYSNYQRRGLCRINLANNAIMYYRPTNAFLDEYDFDGLTKTADGKEIILSNFQYGVDVFSVETAVWEHFDNTNMAGLFVADPQASQNLAYDEAKEFIFLGIRATGYTGGRITYFYRHGFMTQPQYLSATYSGTAWSYGTKSPLLTPRTDKDLVMTIDPASAGGSYAFWLHVNPDGTLRVRWDKDLADFILSDYLVAGSSVQIKRSIDGTPNKLSFTVTHGHLFDPHNTESLWSMVLKKYRRIRVRFGEEIGGVRYWHEAGTFVVVSTKLSHARGEYPNISVECEDIRIWWEDAEIVATEHYEMTPEQILVDVISTWGGMIADDVVIPAMEGSYEVWFQWLDSTVKKLVDSFAGRFGYFPTITVDNKFTVRKISNVNPVDHTYTGLSTIIGFTPDDDFSDFTNRVTVVGESRDFIDVLYEEESVGSLFGTAGWWGHKQTFDVWYSDDHKRKAKNPRLKVIESVRRNSFIAKLGGGSQSIVSVDADEFFCTVEVQVPDMSTVAWTVGAVVLVTGITMGITGCWMPSVAWAAFIGWVALLSILLYILSGIVNWQYEIYARPFGQQRLGCSGQANDVDLQVLLNRVNERKLDEPLCITPEQCKWLAEHELMIVKMQRSRVKFEKITHLQDEEGDTIVFLHPYSGKKMTVFVTDLTRSFHVPKPDGGSGGFTDSITGWKVWPL